MKILSRAAISGAFAVAPLMLLAGCGTSGSASSREPLTPVQPTSYAELPPATTTTTTTLPPDTVIEAGGTSPIEQTHTIKSGDTLSGIASQYGVSMDVIINYNGWTDGTAHVLLPGAAVLIPPNAIIPGQATATGDVEVIADPGETPVVGEGCQHTIVAGDNPTRVAKKYNITVIELENANINNPVWNTFLLGSQLTIPANGTC